MNRITYWFCRIMLAASKFERAITPAYAGHYPQLRLDIEYWERATQKAYLRTMG